MLPSDPATDWWDKVHLALFADALHEVESHFAIHGNGDIGADIVVLEETLPYTWETSLQVVDELA